MALCVRGERGPGCQPLFSALAAGSFDSLSVVITPGRVIGVIGVGGPVAPYIPRSEGGGVAVGPQSIDWGPYHHAEGAYLDATVEANRRPSYRTRDHHGLFCPSNQ